jgi:assimilatory nitrate reductase catalytic subunit
MGPFSITGQPNAMGGREVGALSNQLTAHMELENPVHHDLVSRFWQTDCLADTSGVKAVDMFDDIASGKIKAIWVMATNPVVTLPNADQVRKAIETCELVIVSECEWNTGTVARADILLPALAWGEKCGTVTNSERRISHQRNFLPHPGEAEEDWWIVSQVAQRMGYADAFTYQSSADIFREYAALSGFENNGTRHFDISGLANITRQDYDELKPIQWPVTTDKPDGSLRLFENKQFFTSTGKAQFIAITPRPPKNPVSIDYPLILNTGRIRDQWHTMTRTVKAARLNTHISEPIVQIHPDDTDSGLLINGQLAILESRWGNMLARIVVTDEQRAGSVFVPMHWNDFLASSGRVNALVNPEVDPISGQPEFKHTPVKVAPYQPVWHGFIFSRNSLTPTGSDYWVKINGEQCVRYEIAGEKTVDNFLNWAKQQLGEEGEWLEYSDNHQQKFRAGKIINNRLEGLVFITPQYDLPSRTWLGQLFAEETLSDDMRMNLLAGKPGAGQPDTGTVVCACFGVGENTIKESIADGSAKTVEALGTLLKAGTNCGSCLPELKQYFS